MAFLCNLVKLLSISGERRCHFLVSHLCLPYKVLVCWMQTRKQDHRSYTCFPHLQDSCLRDKQLVTDCGIQRLPLTSLPGELEADFPGCLLVCSHWRHPEVILLLEVVNSFSSLSLTLIFIVIHITLNTKALVLLRVNRYLLQAFPHDYNLPSQISYWTGTPEFRVHQ